MPEDTTHGPAVPDEVRAHLTASLGSDAIIVTDAGAARLPTGGTVRAFHAAVDGRPNEVVAVTLDDAGELRPLASLVRDLGRNPFVPDFGPVGPVHERPPREPVTIDPKTNDWRLNRCERVTEKITVTVPKTSAPPKADVYLLADTTGSMGSVLASVAAGASAILNNPALPVRRGVGGRQLPRLPGGRRHPQLVRVRPPGVADDDPRSGCRDLRLVVGEGSDGPEGQLFALHQIATDPASAGGPTASGSWCGSATRRGTTRSRPRSAGWPRTSPRPTATADLTGAQHHRRRGQHHHRVRQCPGRRPELRRLRLPGTRRRRGPGHPHHRGDGRLAHHRGEPGHDRGDARHAHRRGGDLDRIGLARSDAGHGAVHRVDHPGELRSRCRATWSTC